MTFDITVEIALGVDITADPSTWSWTNITAYTQLGDSPYISIVRGRVDWQTQVQPSICTLQVDNADGRFSRLNPLGAYYGQLSKNTPLRVQGCEAGGTPVTRFVGFVSEWPPQSIAGGAYQWVTIRADGVLRRLSRRTKPLKSPLYQTIMGASPVAYVPLEIGAGGEAGLPAVGNHGLVPDGDVTFGVTGPDGSGDLVSLAPGASLRGEVAYTGTGDAWTYVLLFQVPDITSGSSRIAVWTTTGGVVTWTLTYASATPDTMTLIGLDAGGATLVSESTQFLTTEHDQWVVLFVSTKDNAGDLDYQASIHVPSLATTILTVGGGTVAGASAGNVISQTLYADASLPSLIVGHAVVFDRSLYDDDYDAVTDITTATIGFPGETTAARAFRVASEESVILDLGGTTSSTQMGPQSRSVLLDQLREAELAEQGLLVERLTGELGFDRVEVRYNLDVALALDYDEGHIKPSFQPADDDQGLVNDSTVTRVNGATGRYEQTDGTLGSDPTTGVGRYDEAISVNTYRDDQALQIASWRVHLGTVDKYRYPSVNLMMHASPDLLADWLACDISSRVTITNLPDSVGTSANLIIEGYTERLRRNEWHVSLNLLPYSHDVGVYGVDPAGSIDRYAVRDCTLNVAVDDNDTTLVVLPGDRRWSTDSGDYTPELRVVMGGEEIDISGVTNLASYVAVGTAAAADNASVVPGLPAGLAVGDVMFLWANLRPNGAPNLPAGWTTVDAAGGWRLARRTATASESAPTVTISGGSAGDTVIAQIFALRGVDASTAQVLDNGPSASSTDIAFPATGPEDDCTVMLLLANKQDDWTSAAPPAGFTEISEFSSTAGNDMAIYMAYQIQTARAGVQAGVITGTGGTATVGRYVWASVRGLQSMAVDARAVNGIAKSHSVGAAVELANPAIYAL